MGSQGANNGQSGQYKGTISKQNGVIDMFGNFSLRSLYTCGNVKNTILNTLDEPNQEKLPEQSTRVQSSLSHSHSHVQRKSHFSLSTRVTQSSLQRLSVKQQQLMSQDLEDYEPSIWESLNPQIFKRILAHLPEEEYRNINLVSKKWKSMLADHLPSLNPKGFRLTQFQGDIDNLDFEKFKSIEKFSTDRLQLDLLFRDMSEDDKISYCSQLLQKLTVFKKLRCIKLKSMVINVKDLEVLGNLKSLDTLSLSYCQIGVGREQEEERALRVFQKLYNIQSLSLQHIQWVYFNTHVEGVNDSTTMQRSASSAWHYFLISNLRFLVKLRHLSIYNIKSFDKDQRCVYQDKLSVGSYQKLETLSVSTPIEVNQVGSLQAFTHMKNLQQLRANFYPSTTLVATQLVNIFEKGFEKLTRLESFTLGISLSSRIFNYEEQLMVLKGVFKFLGNLQHLQIDCLEEMHWMSIWTAVSTIPKLTSLSIKGALVFGAQTIQRQLPEYFQLDSIVLDIRTQEDEADTLVMSEEANEVFSRLYRLKYVEFSCNGVNELINVFMQRIPARSKESIQKLLIKGKQSCVMTQILKMVNLRELQIIDFNIRLHSRPNYTFKKLEHLKLLRICNCKFLDHSNSEEEKFTLDWINTLKDLENLQLQSLPQVEEESLLLLDQFSKLYHLDLSQSGFLYNNNLNVIGSLENIRVLNLSGQPPENHVTKQHNFAWTKALSQLSNLEELSLDYCVSLRKIDIQYITGCEKLRKLSLLGCIRLDQKCLKYFKEMKHLQEIDLSANPFIRPDHCQKQLEDKDLLPYGRLEHSQVYTD